MEIGIKAKDDNKKKKIPVIENLFHIPESEEDKPYLIGSKCKICNLVTFPRLAVCPRCAEKNSMEITSLSGKGKINSFCILNVGLPGFQIPSVQAQIDLIEGPRIWSLVTGCEASEKAVRIGMDVKLVIKKIKEDEAGNDIVSYQFQP